jgi:hypothetical protein
MQPLPRKRRKRKGLLGTLVVLLLIVSGVAATAFLLAQTQPPQADYLVAAQNLAVGTVLEASALGSLALPEGSVPGAIPASQQDSVLGQVVSRALLAGDLLSAAHLCRASSVTCQLLPEATGAQSPLLFRLSTQGLLLPAGLQPGDKIDLFLVLKDPSGPCTSDLIAGLPIEGMDADGSSITFKLAPAVVSLIITAQNTGSLVVVGAAPTEQFQVLVNGAVACPSTAPAPGATASPHALP